MTSPDRTKNGPTPKRKPKTTVPGQRQETANPALERKRLADRARDLQTVIAADVSPNPAGFARSQSEDMRLVGYDGDEPPYVNRKVRRFIKRYMPELNPDDYYIRQD
jgi:hypothetical protein